MGQMFLRSHRPINTVLSEHRVNGAMTLAPSLPLQQSPAFAAALMALGVPVSSTDPVILQRRIGPLGRIGFASRGPLVTSDLRRLRRDGLRVFNAEYDMPTVYKAAGFRQIITPVHIAEMQLTGTPQDRFAAHHPKWRNQLRRAQNAKMRVRETVWDGDAHPIFAAADAMSKQRKFKTYPTTLLAAIATTTPDSALIFEAYARGHLIAAILVLRHGPTATYQTAWTTPEGRTVHAHNLLISHATERLAALGHTTFDLGVVNTEHAASLARFKLRTGARLRRLGGTWAAIPGL